MTRPNDTTDEREARTVRVSFRSTMSNFEKLQQIAKALGLVNGSRKPNVSGVLDFVVGKFGDEALKAAKAAKKKNGHGS